MLLQIEWSGVLSGHSNRLEDLCVRVEIGGRRYKGRNRRRRDLLPNWHLQALQVIKLGPILIIGEMIPMILLTCLGVTLIGNHGKNGEILLLCGKLMPQEPVNDQIDPIAALMQRAKARARKVRRGKVNQRAE